MEEVGSIDRRSQQEQSLVLPELNQRPLNTKTVMKTSCRLLLFSAALVLALGACSKKPDVQSSVSELEKAFPSAAAPAPVQTQPTAPTPVPQADANDLVKSALTAARANDYASGVIALQAAQAKPGVTADQVMAVQRAKQAMVAELQRRAINGDQHALAQLKAIERTRSQ
jgi:hypothetical protein